VRPWNSYLKSEYNPASSEAAGLFYFVLVFYVLLIINFINYLDNISFPVLAPPAPYTMMATHAIQPIVIIINEP